MDHVRTRPTEFKCPFCEQVFKRAGNLRRHRLGVHGLGATTPDRTENAPQDPFPLPKDGPLSEANVREHSYGCACGGLFYSDTAWQKHADEAGGGQAHRLVHRPDGRVPLTRLPVARDPNAAEDLTYRCLCGKAFSTRRSLDTHIQTQRGLGLAGVHGDVAPAPPTRRAERPAPPERSTPAAPPAPETAAAETTLEPDEDLAPLPQLLEDLIALIPRETHGWEFREHWLTAWEAAVRYLYPEG